MFSCHKIIIVLQLNNTLLIVLSLLNPFFRKKVDLHSLWWWGGGGECTRRIPLPTGL